MQGVALTTDQKQKFLARLRSARGNVSKACKAAGISRNAAYDNKKSDADFKEAWEQVEAAIVDDAEQELHVRAVAGWREPVFYKGEMVATVRKKSDRLLEFFLRGNRPEKYRERLDLSANVAGSLDVALQASIDKVYGDADIIPGAAPGLEVDADIYDESQPIDSAEGAPVDVEIDPSSESGRDPER